MQDTFSGTASAAETTKITISGRTGFRAAAHHVSFTMIGSGNPTITLKSISGATEATIWQWPTNLNFGKAAIMDLKRLVAANSGNDLELEITSDNAPDTVSINLTGEFVASLSEPHTLA